MSVLVAGYSLGFIVIYCPLTRVILELIPVIFCVFTFTMTETFLLKPLFSFIVNVAVPPIFPAVSVQVPFDFLQL